MGTMASELGDQGYWDRVLAADGLELDEVETVSLDDVDEIELDAAMRRQAVEQGETE